MEWIPIVDKRYTSDTVPNYVRSEDTTWAKFLVIHNTGVPNLDQRPNGFTEAAIQELVDYYKNDQKWHAGPHFFVDDTGMTAFTPLSSPGVHSPSWNHESIGIEHLGNYASDDPTTGRGAAVIANGVALCAILCVEKGFNPDEIRFHKEDPKTTHYCPGPKLIKEDYIQAVKDEIARRKSE